MLRSKLFPLILLGSFLTFTVVSFAATALVGKYTRNADGTIEYSGQKTIFLNTSSNNNSSESKLDLSTFNVNVPTECDDTNIACEETTEITVTTKKTWTPIRLASITSATLRPDLFAKYFPDLPADQTITNGSPVKTKLIAQRILYERGLLPVLPTGRFGYLTELATMQLQCIKGFSEYDPAKKIFLVGPKTVATLNTLKQNLRLSDYLATHPLPVTTLTNCGEDFRTREVAIDTALGALATAESGNQTQATGKATNKNIPFIKPSFLQLDGQITIKKQ